MKPLIIYQKLTEDKIDTFIQMRINQLREKGATEDVDLAPDMGVLLYTAFGFVKNTNFMQYRID